MHILVRLAVAGYIVMLSLALLAGSWPLQGPVLFSVTEGRGLHLGDTAVLLVSALMAGAALTNRPGGGSRTSWPAAGAAARPGGTPPPHRQGPAR